MKQKQIESEALDKSLPKLDFTSENLFGAKGAKVQVKMKQEVHKVQESNIQVYQENSLKIENPVRIFGTKTLGPQQQEAKFASKDEFVTINEKQNAKSLFPRKNLFTSTQTGMENQSHPLSVTNQTKQKQQIQDQQTTRQAQKQASSFPTSNQQPQLATQSHSQQPQNPADQIKKPIDDFPLNKIHFLITKAYEQETLVSIKHTHVQFKDLTKSDIYEYREKDPLFGEPIPKLKFQEYASKMVQGFSADEATRKFEQKKTIRKYWNRRYYLFSRFDRGVKIDREGWYSVTPEPLADYIADRVNKTFKRGGKSVNSSKNHHRQSRRRKLSNYNNEDEELIERDPEEEQEPLNVMDCFGGVGGNVISFAKKCGFCVGVDLDPIKVDFIRHNAHLYDLKEPQQVQVIYRDFLELEDYKQIAAKADSDTPNFIKFPATSSNREFQAVFMSPPWGGQGYHMLDQYSLDQVYPDFDKIIEKATRYSPNLIIFLPKNTSVTDLAQRLAKFQNRFLGETRLSQIDDVQQILDSEHTLQQSDGKKVPKMVGELALEIETVNFDDQCKGVVVYTGMLAQMNSKQVLQAFLDQYCFQGPGGSHSLFQSTLQSSKKGSRGGSEVSSVKSGGSKSSHGNKSGGGATNDLDYLRSILQNVASMRGHHNLLEIVRRGNKSKLSLQKIVRQIQGKFSAEEWYYLRKIHKKDRNYFLNKGGSRESSTATGNGTGGGGGWVAFSAKKTSRSTTSRLSRGSISSVEETKTGGFSGIAANSTRHSNMQQADRYSSSGGRGGGAASGRGVNHKRTSMGNTNQAGRKSALNSRVRTYSGSASSSVNCEEDVHDDNSSQDVLSLSDYQHDMMMIDEAVSSEEDVGDSSESENNRLIKQKMQDDQMPEILDPSKKKRFKTEQQQQFGGSQDCGDEHMIDLGGETNEETSFKRVIPRRRNRNHIELRDLTEIDFLDLIEAKNQDKRFFGWLNFKPLFQEIEQEDDALMAAAAAENDQSDNVQMVEQDGSLKGGEVKNTAAKKSGVQPPVTEDAFQFFTDLFGLNIDDEM